MSEPHSIMGTVEAQKVLRLLDMNNAAALATLNGMALAMGVAAPGTDAATVTRRMRQHAEEALRWHTNPRG
jgi:hypothetical protein